jgi:hypothetical protein
LKRTFVIFLLMVSTSISVAGSDTTLNEVDFNGHLYESLFYATFFPEKLNNSNLPDEVQPIIKKYVDRANSFRSKLEESNYSAGPDKWGHEKQQIVEKGIVILIDEPDIEKLAAEYAKKVKIYYEWEGMSDSPLDEAKYAEEYLKKNTHTPLRPYLNLFIIHRYRCAFECLVLENNAKKQKEASQKYHYYLTLAKKSSDLIIRLIADDIDKQEYIYINTKQHP